jgi:hypothetical protein
MFTTIAIATLALTACKGPDPVARNPNGTLALACSGNYACNKETGSFSRFSSDPRCFDASRGPRVEGCGTFDGGAAAPGASGL